MAETAALSNVHGRRNLPHLDVVLRTRRAVMEAANEMKEQRIRHRRHLGIALLMMSALVVLLTPAIWSSVDDLFGGEHLFDAPAMVMSLILLLFSGVFAVLIFSWSRNDRLHNGKR
ncbi:hypothetical protein [Paracidobacterium acidisoli]|uniref:hypothetical protein n=1 Tax=Paracidobacterium acidisoli TaxID=2303751 RepID=UPI0011C0DA7E|nr:hypothetical protein [Paracidobacterium acidisoli]MBT9332118.1 hypothetical protein [Paracidobacterium acidisoli]